MDAGIFPPYEHEVQFLYKKPGNQEENVPFEPSETVPEKELYEVENSQSGLSSMDAEVQFLYKKPGNQAENVPFEPSELVPEKELYEVENSQCGLSSIDTAKLRSCVESMQDVVGDTIPEAVLEKAAYDNKFDLEKALDSVLLDKIQQSPTKASKSKTTPRSENHKRKKAKLEKSKNEFIETWEPPKFEKKDDYQKLLALEDSNLISNVEKFECPVCFLDVEVGEGTTLKECLHSFCKECLVGAIQFSENAVVKCPFGNAEYSCESHLQEREIKSLVTPEVYERHLQRSITHAENQAQDSFHCKTPDCRGWCLFEDNVNTFLCPVCNRTNCINCAAIHEGKNCRQYQDDVQCNSSEEGRKTKKHLQNMLDNGDAMRCPTCEIFVMKKSGCDNLICLMCHTRFLWKGRPLSRNMDFFNLVTNTKPGTDFRGFYPRSHLVNFPIAAAATQSQPLQHPNDVTESKGDNSRGAGLKNHISDQILAVRNVLLTSTSSASAAGLKIPNPYLDKQTQPQQPQLHGFYPRSHIANFPIAAAATQSQPLQHSDDVTESKGGNSGGAGLKNHISDQNNFLAVRNHLFASPKPAFFDVDAGLKIPNPYLDKQTQPQQPQLYGFYPRSHLANFPVAAAATQSHPLQHPDDVTESKGGNSGGAGLKNHISDQNDFLAARNLSFASLPPAFHGIDAGLKIPNPYLDKQTRLQQPQLHGFYPRSHLANFPIAAAATQSEPLQHPDDVTESKGGNSGEAGLKSHISGQNDFLAARNLSFASLRPAFPGIDAVLKIPNRYLDKPTRLQQPQLDEESHLANFPVAAAATQSHPLQHPEDVTESKGNKEGAGLTNHISNQNNFSAARNHSVASAPPAYFGSEAVLEIPNPNLYMQIQPQQPQPQDKNSSLMGGSGFNYGCNLLGYMRVTTTGDKPFQCEVCGESFSQKNYLARHSMSHRGFVPQSQLANFPVAAAATQSHPLQHPDDVTESKGGKSGGAGLTNHIPNQNNFSAARNFSVASAPPAYFGSEAGLEIPNPNLYMQIQPQQPQPQDKNSSLMGGSGFNYGCNLLGYMRETTTGDKPFQREVCGESFSQKNYLARHSISHRGFVPQSHLANFPIAAAATQSHPLRHPEDVTESKGGNRGGAGLTNHIPNQNNFSAARNFSVASAPPAYFGSEAGLKIPNPNLYMQIQPQRPQPQDKNSSLMGGSGFNYGCNLLGYMRETTTGDKPFRCEVCGESFSQKNYLTRHSMSHRDKGPYLFDIYGRRFSRKDKLTQHHKIHTDNIQQSPIEDRLSFLGKRKRTEEKLEKTKREFNNAWEAEFEKKDDYQKLLALDDFNLISNLEKFECPVCFLDVEVGKGAVLKDCLHSFCKECLAGAIQFSENAVVKCPFGNDEYSCESHLQEREIKSLVTTEVYERHLQRSIALAESQAQNSFHCKTPDCPGWCLFEDNVNTFLCPVCNRTNCLMCAAIHEGRNCKQYQDDVQYDSSKEGKKSKTYLQNMLDKGEAMRCPKCQVILMKKSGCDALTCLMCQTRICWATKGPRWGPGGPGDTSGGCRCKVNGVKCHPNCSSCH